MKSVLINYFKKNKLSFFILFVFFIIGILLGVYIIKHLDDIEKNEIYNYIDLLIKNLKQDNNISKTELLYLSLKKNLLFIILLWFLGCTIVGIIFIYFFILYKGFILGYTIAAIIIAMGIKHGILFFFVTMFLQNLIYIPTCFIMCESRVKIM